MLVTGQLSFNSNQITPVKPVAPQNVTVESPADSAKMPLDKIPSSALRASALAFTSIKMTKTDFADRVQDKIAQIEDGTFVRQVKPKAIQNLERGDALLNIAGPLKLVCKGVKASDLADLNNEFARVSNVDDLKHLLMDPRIPADKPIVITEPSTSNYTEFMKAVDKANTSKDPHKVIAQVSDALDKMGGATVQIPEISLEFNRKGLGVGLINHLEAGLPYDTVSLITSPYIDFQNKDSMAVRLPQPVYDR